MVAIYSTMTNANDGDNDDIDKVQSEAPDFIKKYEIKASIGKGLSSTVYVCVDKNSGNVFYREPQSRQEFSTSADNNNNNNNKLVYKEPRSRQEFSSYFLHFATPRPFYRAYSFI